MYERDQGKEQLENMKIRKHSFPVEIQLYFTVVKCKTKKILKQSENLK